jgi:Ankyrin repeats (3 copies)
LFLDTTLEKRGYSTDRFFVHESGYYNSVTQKQQLSYHSHIIDLVKANDVEQLRYLFAAGLSTNPANAYGEGLIHLVCRTGAVDVLKVMINSGCDVQVSDDYGRTPLHDACWSANPSCTYLIFLSPSFSYFCQTSNFRLSILTSLLQSKLLNYCWRSTRICCI